MIESSIVQNVERLKNLPKTWKIKNFTTLVSDNSAGNKKLAKSDFLEEGDIAIVDQGKELVAGFYNDTSIAVKTSPPYIIFGDHTRIFKFIDFPFIMGADGTKVLQPVDNRCETKYLYYFFLSIDVPNTGYNRHYKYLKDLKIPLPPIEIQKKIAAILDAAEAYKQKTKALIDKYDVLSQSLFLEMFGDPVSNPKGWQKAKADKYIDLLTGHAFKSKEYSINPEHIKLCGGLIIMPWGIEWSKCNTWDPEKSYGLERYWLKENDIVMAMDRPWISSGFKISMLKSEDVPSLLVQRTARIRSTEINSTFLYFLYKHKAFERQAITTETTVPHISPKDIRNYEIIIPPTEMQKQFANHVQSLEAQKALAQKSLIKAEDLFNSLLQKAFKGELV